MGEENNVPNKRLVCSDLKPGGKDINSGRGNGRETQESKQASDSVGIYNHMKEF